MSRWQLVLNPEENDYAYYEVFAPWVVVKLLRLLQVFPFPAGARRNCRTPTLTALAADAGSAERVTEALNAIVSSLSDGPKVHRKTACTSRLTSAQSMRANPSSKPKQSFFNAKYSVFFEAVNLIVSYDRQDCQKLVCAFSHRSLQRWAASAQDVHAARRVPQPQVRFRACNRPIHALPGSPTCDSSHWRASAPWPARRSRTMPSRRTSPLSPSCCTFVGMGTGVASLTSAADREGHHHSAPGRRCALRGVRQAQRH